MDEVNKLYNELSGIKYGWHDKDGNVHTNLKEGKFVKDYIMQNIDGTLEYAICWELVEKERLFFKEHKIPFITVFAYLKMGNKYPCHTFLIFKKGGYYYWFEASWEMMKGVKRYSSTEDVFDTLKDNFEDFTRTKDYDKDSIQFMKYKAPRKGIKCNPFYYHCMYFSKRIKDSKKIKEFEK